MHITLTCPHCLRDNSFEYIADAHGHADHQGIVRSCPSCGLASPVSLTSLVEQARHLEVALIEDGHINPTDPVAEPPVEPVVYDDGPATDIPAAVEDVVVPDGEDSTDTGTPGPVAQTARGPRVRRY